VSLRRLLVSHLRPYKKLLVIVVILQILQTTATLALPAYSADIIDQGVLAGDNASIRSTGVTMLVITMFQVVFGIGAVWFGARSAMSFGRDVRRDLFDKVLSFSAREVGTFGAPSLITRITNDVQQVQLMVVMGTTMMIAAPLTMVIGIIMALRQDVNLSVVLLVCVPAAAILLGSIVYRMVPGFQAMQDRIDRVNRVLREQITGIRVVRAFVREPQEEERFAEANEELTATSLGLGRLQAAMFPTVTVIVNVSSIAVLWVGADLISEGELQVGSLIAYLTYLLQILISVVMATFMVSMIPRAAVAAERIQSVLDTSSSVVPPVEPTLSLPEQGTLEMRAVEFRYPGAESPVLEEISFRVEAGQTTAVVGSTGAGKTTLVNLVSRLFDATGGTVTVGGVDVRDLDPALLAATVGYVPQKPYLFSGTVATNLRFARPDATDEELWEALRIAQADDFVRAMPDGLDSSIAQGGASVSGGQRQRLSIARALVARPQVYVFDDSFSALDLTTDARLRAALAPHIGHAAVLLVAQRISTIVDADQILVLEDGFVVGKGTHADLLETCPTYHEIVESQTGQDEEAVA
jgi:ATP-binding cassette subfamily B protein